MQEDEFFDELYEIANTVIYVDEISPEEIRKKEVFKESRKLVEGLFLSIDEEINHSRNDEEKCFTKEVYLNFILFSLKKIIVQYDMPDDNIVWIAGHIKDKLIECTRKSY